MTNWVWRKRLKMTGLVLTILMLGLWVLSITFPVTYTFSNRHWYVVMRQGYVFVIDISHPKNRTFPIGWTSYSYISYLKKLAGTIAWTRFARDCLGFGFPYKDSTTVCFPLWLFVVATGFPTAILWRRDRRPKAGFCKVCKYDLTGNVSGTCPECGTAV